MIAKLRTVKPSTTGLPLRILMLDRFLGKNLNLSCLAGLAVLIQIPCGISLILIPHILESPKNRSVKMRRAVESSGSRTYSDYNAVDDENERLVDSLQDKVSTLKSLSIDIGTEVREQNSFLQQLDDTFDSSGGLLSSTMGRLTKMARSGHNCYLCYLLLFAFFVFFIIYFIIRFR